MADKKMKAIGYGYMAYYCMMKGSEFLFPLILIGAGFLLLVKPPADMEESLEISKTTLLGILALFMGMGVRPKGKR